MDSGPSFPLSPPTANSGAPCNSPGVESPAPQWGELLLGVLLRKQGLHLCPEAFLSLEYLLFWVRRLGPQRPAPEI